jgi:hypothetical protein
MNKKTKSVFKAKQNAIEAKPKLVIETVDFGEDFIMLSEPKVENIVGEKVVEIGKPEDKNEIMDLIITKNHSNVEAILKAGDDFEIENKDTIATSNIDFDPKTLYTKSLKVKRKPLIYSTLRTVLIVLGLLFFVLISALSIGYNISEFENPDIGGKEIINEITDAINPNLVETRPLTPNSPLLDPNTNRRQKRGNIPMQLPPQIAQQIEQRREANLAARILGISFEFILIAAILTLLSYLIYRHTDWPFVKNKILLAFLIVIVSIIISLGFWILFRNDSRIPRALRGHRDDLRGHMMFQDRTRPPIIERN